MTTRILALIITTLLCKLSYSQTEYSKYIEELQAKFGHAREDQPIVYLDLDQIKMKLADLGLNPTEQEQAQVIVNFIKRTSDLTISLPNAETLFFRLNVGSVSATPLQSVDKQKVCVVIPSNPNLNQKQTAHRLLQWEHLHDKEEYKNKKIKQYLPRKINSMISDIHETFHCLDEWFLPNSYNSSIDSAMIHRSEAFAEAGALLYLKHLGHDNINDIRANTRLVGSYMTTKLPKNPFGEPLPWGAIYSLQRVIRAIDPLTNNDLPIGWELSEIKKMAKSITDLYAYNSHEFYGLSEFHENKDFILSNIEKYRMDDYDYIRERFLIIERTILSYEEELKKSLDSLLTEANNEHSEFDMTEENTAFNLSSDCPNIDYFSDDNMFSSQIDELRATYYEKNSPAKGIGYLALENIYACLNYKLSKDLEVDKKR